VRLGAWVTGLGVLSPIGAGTSAFWTALLEGRVGVGGLTRYPAAALRSPMAGECSDPGGAPQNLADRLALVAAREALAQAGLERLPEGAGIALGAGVGGLPESEETYFEWLKDRRLAGRRRRFLGHLPSTTADLLAAEFGAGGPRISVANACTSSTAAVGQGAVWIAMGETECVLAGASDVLSRLTVGGFNSLRLVSQDPPRPFDRRRSGMAVGEGAAFLVLESGSHARARGARPLAVLDGFGLSADGFHATAPQPEGGGALRAMRQALAMADCPVEELDHVNAHGTGTQANDRAEGKALLRLLGPRAASVPVVSIKGAVGHSLGAAGAVEAAASVLSIVHQAAPPTAGFLDSDPDIPLRVLREALALDIRTALCVNLAFGGNNAALLFRRPS
jgi:3-oxoacyl-[acyl-carrier-protein] synthase II